MRFFRYSWLPRRLPGRSRAAWLLLCGLLLLAGRARASHIVGGELELTHTTGQSYVLTLNLYFDAVNGTADLIAGSVTASIFDKATNGRMQDLALPIVENTFVNYSNPLCARPTLSTRKLVYSKEVILPTGTYSAPQGYYVAVEQCCRNLSIANIVNPGNAAQAFYLEFPAVVRSGQPFVDSTPRMFPALSDYACLGEPFYFDFGGTDPDGDSLVYELATPLNGHASINVPRPTATAAPYAPIAWVTGLGATNPLPGTPTLRIDRRTGRLSARPAALGLYAFGIRCSEFRQGEKIGEVRRDFQLMVLSCPPNARPSLTVVLPGATGPVRYRPGRDTLRLGPGSNRCVRVRFTDPDLNSRLSLAVRPVNFRGLLPAFSTPSAGIVHAAGQPDTLSSTLCFPDCLDSRGQVWQVDVIVADDGCSLPKRDTVRLAFVALPLPSGPPTISSTAPAAQPLVVRVGDVVSFDVQAAAPFNQSVQLDLAGQNFVPADLGASLTPAGPTNPQLARFRWPVDCRVLTGDSVRVFQFTATSVPCGLRQTAVLKVAVVVRYANAAPVLRTTGPLPAPGPDGISLVSRQLGASFTLELTGTDANRDNLTLTASSDNFTLAEAGMTFTARNGAGSAAGTFRWDVGCGAVNLHRPLDVTFQLLDATCRPLPQRQVVRFEVEPPASPVLTLYNVITPNADGQNDEFRLPELPVDFCDNRFARIQVFSRWGQSVFESADRNFRWPGQGQAGTYYYLATYTDGRRYKGWLEIKP
ncbi:gliding motility-associated C-terminal domain-containing protein [Hymenobacter sp. UYCo722]|uniref:gliding motility-associated C-terminal domain-containing protein n=1 Tax=Hymenobacter sp. UYCo722 TaxID=3156335 RepID=UPI003395485E